MFCPFEHVAIFLYRVSSSLDALTTATILNVPEDWVTTVTMQVLECASSLFDSPRSVFSGTLALLPRFLPSCGGRCVPTRAVGGGFQGPIHTNGPQNHFPVIAAESLAWKFQVFVRRVYLVLLAPLHKRRPSAISIAVAHLAHRMQNRKHIPQPPLTSKVARLVVEKLKRRYVSWPGAEEQAELAAEWEEKTDMR